MEGIDRDLLIVAGMLLSLVLAYAAAVVASALEM